MSLEDDFNAAKEKITATKQGQQEQLQLYALFKQITVGDNTGKRPGITKFIERHKFDAWAAHNGMSKDVAMQKYIDLVAKFTA